MSIKHAFVAEGERGGVRERERERERPDVPGIGDAVVEFR
jgi:hypothetical protein